MGDRSSDPPKRGGDRTRSPLYSIERRKMQCFRAASDYSSLPFRDQTQAYGISAAFCEAPTNHPAIRRLFERLR